MIIGYAIAGLLLGLFLAGGYWAFGAIAGAALGVLFGRLHQQNARLASLEERLHELGREAEPTTGPPPEPAAAERPEPPTPWPLAERPVAKAAVEPPAPPPEPTPLPPLERPAAPTAVSKAPELVDRLIEVVKRWFTTGNIPVKVGVIVSFFGVAFLLKYAADHDLLRLPIELRLLGVAIGGIVLLVFGWRLRASHRVYALSLQGGGVGVLYLTIFAAMRLYELVPPGLAFLLLVALTAFSGALAVFQNSRAIAILGIVGGFLAPVLVSTGEGNHVILFSYYLVLNAAILGIAWFRAWRELNLLGFVFTFVIGGIWGYENYRPELFATTEPFLIAYFLFYQGIAILFTFRQPVHLKGLVDGTLVFGTPVVAFALQAVLVDDFEYGLAISAVALGLFYALTATILHRLARPPQRLLVEAYIALGVAFGTIAIPLAFDARWTAAAWALEGAALVWVGSRQQRILARASGFALSIASGIAFLDHGWQSGAGLPVLNGNFLGGLLIGLASLFSARYLSRRQGPWPAVEEIAAWVLFLWGVAWWLGTGLVEIDDRAATRFEPGLIVAFFTLTAALSFVSARRLDWVMPRHACVGFLPALAFATLPYLLRGEHPFAAFGWAVWPVAIGVQYWILRNLESLYSRIADGWHAATLVFVTALVAWELGWQVDRLDVAAIWAPATASLVPGLVVLGVISLRERVVWPLSQRWNAYGVIGCGVLVMAQLLVVLQLNLTSSGDPSPLPYLPIANPLDIATIFMLLVAAKWLMTVRQMTDRYAEQMRLVWGGLGFLAWLTSTAAVIRAVHHLAGVPFEADALSGSVLVQAALSIYWSVLGFAGMVFGARSNRRLIWLIGAGLMAIVVVKLFLVDLGNTGTVARIVSFIGVGILLLVVGYFAPVPPRQRPSESAAGGDA